MRAQKFYAFIAWTVALVMFGVVVYQFNYNPCDHPIKYKIGAVDAGFGMSQEQFKEKISTAVAIWNAALGKKLFEYDPNGSLTINLSYDSRQQTTQQDQVLQSTIDQNSQLADSTKQQYTALANQYDQQKSAYEEAVSKFNLDQGQYNSSVNYWNAKGGAPASQYTALQNQRKALIAEENQINTSGASLNTLVSEINSFIDKYNILVDHIKSNANIINSSAGTEFEEGVYDPNTSSITIYEYDNEVVLIRVIAHELGHALGLAHDSDPASIMYRLNQGTNETLSAEDLAELKTVCRVK